MCKAQGWGREKQPRKEVLLKANLTREDEAEVLNSGIDNDSRSVVPRKAAYTSLHILRNVLERQCLGTQHRLTESET